MNEANNRKTVLAIAVPVLVLQLVTLVLALLWREQVGKDNIEQIAVMLGLGIVLCIVMCQSKRRVNYKPQLRNGRLDIKKEVAEWDSSGLEQLAVAIIIASFPLNGLFMVFSKISHGPLATILDVMSYVMLIAGITVGCVVGAIPTIRKYRSRKRD